MTVKMAEQEKTPPVYVLDNTATPVIVQRSTTSNKSGTIKKRVIIAVTSVLVVVLVLTAILIGVKFYCDSTHDVINRTFEFVKSQDGKEKVKEDVSADVTENILKYHLNDDDKEIWIISDYNRDIEILKAKTTDGFSCYVTPLNGTASARDEIENATSPSEVVETVETSFDVSTNPVKELSILGKSGQEMCDGIDVYWMTPSCDTGDTAPGEHRDERAACSNCIFCCHRRVCRRGRCTRRRGRRCVRWHRPRCRWYRQCRRKRNCRCR